MKKGRDLVPVKQPKKLLIMNILDILRKYSDEEHRLSQKDIAEILKTEYDMTADRKAIRRNILNLMDCGYNIEYSESIRMVPNPKTGNQRRATCGRTSIWSRTSPMASCGCSLTACFFPSTFLTASARSWWVSWRVCPMRISAAG